MSKYATAAFGSITIHLSIVTSMLIRNIIFARFLSASDFAVTLTFGLVLSLFEYISNFGHENFLQRSQEGGLSRLQATMHSTMIVRGVLVSIGMILIAPFVPIFLDIKDVDFNYAWLAIVPFLNGFAHLDHQRLHRQHNYMITARITLIADVSSILVALTCILIWENYWAFYVSFVFRHSVSTALSHLFAQRKYSLALDRQHFTSLIKFGAPLLVVGLLKFISIEFDKAIVARSTGLEIFAVYVLTLMLLVNGTNIITLALSKIFIRRISTSGKDLTKVIIDNGLIHCFFLLPLLALLCGIGENLIQLIFGNQYITVPFLIIIVGAVVGIRSINQWLNQTVIARMPTKLMLMADLFRVFIALFGVWLVYSNGDVITIAIAFWVSELCYFFCLSLLLNKLTPILSTSFRLLSIYAATMACIYLQYAYSFESNIMIKSAFSSLMFIFIAGSFLLFSATCQNQALVFVRLVSSRLKRTKPKY